MDGDNHFRRWYDLVYSTAYPKAGRAPVTAELLQERLEEAGFKEVEVVAYRHPFGPWSKDPKMKQLGAVVLLQCESGIEAYSLAPLTRWLGMEVEEVHKLCRDALEEVKTSKRHMYNYLWVPCPEDGRLKLELTGRFLLVSFVAHGRKPDDDEVDDVENNKEDEEEEDDHGRRHNHGRRSCKH